MTTGEMIRDLTFGFDPVGSWLLVIGVAAILGGLLFLVGPDRSRLSVRGCLVLTLLRLAAMLCLLVCLLRPTLVGTGRSLQQATLLVLADSSESMTVADGPNGQSRWDYLRQTLQQAVPAAQRAVAKGGLDIHTWVFDQESREHAATPGQLFDLGDWQRLPTVEETAIGAALEAARRALADQPLAGVVLLSDGGQHAYPPRDLPPQTEARRLGEREVPLWAITFGRARGAAQSQDAAVLGLSISEKVFLGNVVEVVGRVRLDGLSDRDAVVKLLVEKVDGRLAEVARRRVRAASGTTEETVRLEWTPEALGERKVQLVVEPIEGETVASNNEVSTFVDVVDGGLRVLYLEGEPRVEQRFLRRTLAASPDMQIDFRWIDSTQRNHWPIDLSEELTQDYKVFLIGDLDASALRPGDLATLRARVEAGAGIGLLGGFHAFEAGGWGSSPLGRLLPYEQDPLARQQFGEPIRSDLHIRGPLVMLPDRRFGSVTMLRQGESLAESLEVWKGLPTLDGANRLPRLLPMAKTLAVTADAEPLLVAREYGLGRVLTLAVDSTWRWAMQGAADAHRRFWRQLVLWLARRDDADGETLWLKLARRRVSVGSPLVFDTGITRPDGTLVEEIPLSARVMNPAGQSLPLRLIRKGEAFTGTVPGGVEPGDWKVIVRSGPDAEEQSARFTVYRQDLELANPRANSLLMGQIANATTGGTRLPEELPAIFDELAERPAEYATVEQWSFSIWDNWVLLFLLTGCLGVEWFLRKRWGLV
jgi:hypothetical protein